jgi:hypothetical protein
MPDAVAAPSFPLADAIQLEGTLRVMARRLHAEHSGPVALVGLRRRGVPHLLSRRACVVEYAVLCARGQPEVPVTAGTVGMRLDVPAGLAIEVHVPPFEEDLGVWIRRVDG